MTNLQLVLVSGEMDPECRRCDTCIEITSIGVMEDGEFICLDCADRLALGFAQIVRGLDLIHEAVCLDGLLRVNAREVADMLGLLSEKVAGLASGSMAARVVREVTEVPWEPDGPIGVRIERGIVPAE